MTAAAASFHRNYFTTSPRNTFANGETVTSPAVSVAGLARPSLLATRISVMPRAGSVISSDDEALTPAVGGRGAHICAPVCQRQ